MKEISNFAGMDGFHWFIGRVEARVVSDGTDPLRLGRVKVRVIGTHTQDKNQLPTEHLPWATIMHPITSAGANGVGSTANLIEGTTVFGFFLDALDKQHPVIIGTIPGRDSPGTNSDVRIPYVPITARTFDEDGNETTSNLFNSLEDCLYKKKIYGEFNEASQSWLDMKESKRGHNPKLIAMLAEIGFPNSTAEDTAWCAAFVSHILQISGYPSLPLDAKLGAKNYQNYPGDVIWNGTDNPIPYDKFQKNDIMVFERPETPGAGHVGLYHSTNGKLLKIVSGNAGTEVTLKIDKDGRDPNNPGRKLLKVIRPIKSSLET